MGQSYALFSRYLALFRFSVLFYDFLILGPGGSAAHSSPLSRTRLPVMVAMSQSCTYCGQEQVGFSICLGLIMFQLKNPNDTENLFELD